LNFTAWSSTSIYSRPLSSCSTYSIQPTHSAHSTHSTLLTPPNSPGEKPHRLSFPKKLINTLSNPQKEHHHIQSTHSAYSTYLTPPNSPGEKPSRLSFPKKLITTLSNPQKEHQQQRKQIIEGVYKLFEGRRKIDNDINDIKMEHSRLLENKAINENSILSKLKEIFERKDKINYIISLRGKVIDEQILSKLEEIFEGESDEIGPILSKLKEILEGNREKSEIRSILSELKGILGGNIEEEDEAIDEAIDEVEEASDTDNTNDYEVEENTDDSKSDVDNYEVIINVDEILDHQKYLDDDLKDANNFNDVKVANNFNDVKDANNLNDVNDAKDEYSEHIEFDDVLYLDNHEVIIFDVDEILYYQKNLDDNVVISDNAVVNDVKDEQDVKDLLQYSNHNLTEEFDDILYLDNYEVIFDVGEVLRYRNHLDDVSDNAVIIVNDDTNDISAKNYLHNYNFVEEFGDDNLIALKESLPSPYNECDTNILKNILPSDYNKLDNVTIINIIQQNNIHVKQENNDQDSESSFKHFKKVVKEVDNLVDKAAEAHQGSVNNEKLKPVSKIEKLEKISSKFEFVNLLEGKIIDELILSKLKEVLEEDSERNGETGSVLSNLKEILEGNRKENEIGLTLFNLKEILEGNMRRGLHSTDIEKSAIITV
jgi:hypothetical protein